MTLFAHWPVLRIQAMSFDDEEAIIQNRLVQSPSWSSIGRFFSEVTFSSVVPGYYRPLTLTSLMADWAMGGRPDDFYVFHRTSLILHLGSTVLLILLVYQVFGHPIPAALTGLLFGVHPLTVEPIAWVMERKTILAAFFAFACLNAYVRYVRRAPDPRKDHVAARSIWYAGAVLLYLLSLLAKPTGTPLPIIMLLMDVWPLKRIGRRAGKGARIVLCKAPSGPFRQNDPDPSSCTPWLSLVLEKVPFLILSGVFAALCVLCEEKVTPLFLPAKLAPLHLPLRLCWLAVFYPCKILLPIHLSSVYILPEPLALTNGLVLLAVAGVVLLAAALVIARGWTPAMWTGAAMFYIGLAPTMGFVGYSWVVASDKYVYLPAVGLVLALGGLLGRMWSGEPKPEDGAGRAGTSVGRTGGSGSAAAKSRMASVVAVLVLASLLVMGTRRYLRHWQTTEALLDYTIALAPNAAPPYYNRGIAQSQKGAYDLAIQDYSRAIELKPDFAPAYNNRGVAYGAKGAYDLAIQDYSKAIALKPDFAAGYNNRGAAYGAKGVHDQAIQDCSKAIELNPNHADAYTNRAVSRYWLKQYDQAWADVRMCRQLGGAPHPDFIRLLAEATGRTE